MVEVEVEFDYEAELSDELTIKAGETIKEVKKMDGGWWEGTLNGRRGVFPDNFVKVRPTISLGLIAKKKTFSRCLTLKRNHQPPKSGQFKSQYSLAVTIVTFIEASKKKSCHIWSLLGFQIEKKNILHSSHMSHIRQMALESTNMVLDPSHMSVYSEFVTHVTSVTHTSNDFRKDQHNDEDSAFVTHVTRVKNTSNDFRKDQYNKPVQLRRGQQSRASASSSSNNKKKQCRVLFSYQPQHEDELELKMEDVVDFVAEVEDGWWKGKLRGRVGVFPSNFVEMIKNHANVNNEDAEQTVQDKNKRNEKLKSVERTQRPPSSKISNLIHDAESKGKKKSLSNLFKGRSRKSSINEDENENSENLGSSLPFLSGSKNKSSSEKAENRDRSKSENETPNTGIEHPHQYAGINKISRSAQTSVDVGLPSIWKKNQFCSIDHFATLFSFAVKEQCIVLFPYNAVNDDELTLEEGQLINIVSKDVEDKGWWKGEIDGKVGVFPDNFVRAITPSTTTTTTTEDAKTKKPSRTTAGANKIAAPLKTKKIEDSTNSTSSSREKLTGSSEKIFKKNSTSTPLKKEAKQPVSLPPVNLAENKSSPKKHSFGKSTPPPKPKPPSIGSKGNTQGNEKSFLLPNFFCCLESLKVISSKFNFLYFEEPTDKPTRPSPPEKQEKAKNNKETSAPTKSETGTEKSKELDLDAVLRSDNKLEHLTSERVKAPKRRPPSSDFRKDAKLSGGGDTFETLEAVALNDDPDTDTSDNLKHKRSASQGSLHSASNENDSNLLSTSTRQESKNRLSFKMDKSKPTNSSAPMTSETINDEQSAKKPDWLAELSRKQANRRSAVFPPASSVVVEPSSDTSTSNVKSGSTSPPKIQNETKPAVAVDKPHIPLKPSQIREE
eukprot:04967.XXX_31418_20456_1 [CDS] Oithona nana genome sequencing.